jgi:hypothetical protein
VGHLARASASAAAGAGDACDGQNDHVSQFGESEVRMAGALCNTRPRWRAVSQIPTRQGPAFADPIRPSSITGAPKRTAAARATPSALPPRCQRVPFQGPQGSGFAGPRGRPPQGGSTEGAQGGARFSAGPPQAESTPLGGSDPRSGEAWGPPIQRRAAPS